MIWETYDGVRSGLASYRGTAHYFNCPLDRTRGEYADFFELWPINQALLGLANEQWHIYRAWERRFHSGDVPLETHPGHRGQNARYDELDDQIKRELGSFGAPSYRAHADFLVRDNQPDLPEGCLREMEVSWVVA